MRVGRGAASGSLAALLALASCAVTAQEGRPPETAVQRLDRAADLADWGRATGDPLALVVAARMSRGLAPDDPLAPETLRNQARLLARGDAEVMALIERETADQDRGVCSGPTRHEGRLSPGQRHTLRLTVAGGEIADAALRLSSDAPPGADLDLTVTDARGRRLADGAGPSTGVPGRSAYVQWRSTGPAEVRVTVANVGAHAADYRLTLAPAQGGDCR